MTPNLKRLQDSIDRNVQFLRQRDRRMTATDCTRRRLASCLWAIRKATRDMQGMTSRVPVWRDLMETLRTLKQTKGNP